LVSPQAALVTATFIRLLLPTRSDGTTATIQLCVRFTLQDVAVPRSEWCSSEEQAGMTLDGAYYSGGNRDGVQCAKSSVVQVQNATHGCGATLATLAS
jgi:hypothetical protein